LSAHDPRAVDDATSRVTRGRSTSPMGPIPYRYEFAETLPGGTEDPVGGFRPTLNPDPIASGSTCNPLETCSGPSWTGNRCDLNVVRSDRSDRRRFVSRRLRPTQTRVSAVL